MVKSAAAGYSGTPLAKKLGYKEAMLAYLGGAPDELADLLHPLPDKVRFVAQASGDVDLAHIFVTEREHLHEQLKTLRGQLRPDAVLWISWPKKVSRVHTTVTEDTIRALALPLGFVDVKVCAVSDVWSGLKLVVRKELRRVGSGHLEE